MLTIARYIITKISDKDFDSSIIPPKDISDYRVRKASRGILINNDKIVVPYYSRCYSTF